jgi:cytidine deaminase/ASC-1-like (ASCH) protein
MKGTKKIEIRASSHEQNYNDYKVSDKIIFINSKNEEILCEITENNHYNTIEELLMLEGTRYTTSSTNDYNEAILNILKLKDYKERINKNGINAIHIQYLYRINDVWNKLYFEAKKVLNPRPISDSVEAGGVAAALLTKNGNIYTGVCIDTACSLGFCAERNAIGAMITNGENEIEKLLCIGSHNDNIMMPCGACRELLLQLSEKNKDMEMITDLKSLEIIKLIDLMPKWWK